MEIELMKKDYQNFILEEQKIITKYIFEGLSSAQIAKKLNYSTSTISNRINSLFAKYKVKTRLEFVISILGEIIKIYKQNLKNSKKEISELQKEKNRLKSIILDIDLYKNDKRKTNIILKKALTEL